MYFELENNKPRIVVATRRGHIFTRSDQLLEFPNRRTLDGYSSVCQRENEHLLCAFQGFERVIEVSLHPHLRREEIYDDIVGNNIKSIAVGNPRGEEILFVSWENHCVVGFSFSGTRLNREYTIQLKKEPSLLLWNFQRKYLLISEQQRDGEVATVVRAWTLEPFVRTCVDPVELNFQISSWCTSENNVILLFDQSRNQIAKQFTVSDIDRSRINPQKLTEASLRSPGACTAKFVLILFLQKPFLLENRVFD